ncbi:hypothetical protein DID78_06200 [Candidatus Marinamargulisbacteria bacterium SCGC AG-343-D04]|nr:hypothetical protein DID78_06200 [Candidatus Marinamargulisbacteria bacterium SCGC AG-343-D04]
MIGKLKCLCVGFLLLVASTTAVHGVSVSASVDRSSLTVNDTFEYKVVVQGASKSISIDPEFLREFHVIRQSTSQSYRMVNGTVSASHIKSFALRPRKVGEFTIPGAKVIVDQQTLQTEPIAVSVVEGSIAPSTPAASTQSSVEVKPQSSQASPDIFLLAQLSKNTAYVGEEVQYKLFLYRRVSRLNDLSYSLPDFGSVLSESLQRDTQTYRKSYGGKAYYVQEIDRRALFPYESGQLSIASSEAEITLGFYFNSQRIRSNTLELTILPVPEDSKPTDFSGLVGTYTLEKPVLESQAFVQGKPVAIKITVKGMGNLKQLSELTVKGDDDFKVYKSSVTDQITYIDQVQGERHFEYIIVPKKSGMMSLPQFMFSSFSPETKTYHVFRTQPIDVDIIASGEAVINDEKAGVGLSVLNEDLHYIVESFSLKQEARHFSEHVFAWVLGVLNGTFFLYVFGVFLDQKGYLQHVKQLIQRNPKQRALKSLNLLKGDVSSESFLSELQGVMYEFLGSVLKRSVQGVTQQELATKLSQSGVSESNIKDVKVFFDRCSFLAYSPKADVHSTSKELVEEAILLVKKVKKDV